MASEKRLIDANTIEKHCRNTKIIELFPEWKDFPYAMKIALIRYGKALKVIIQNAPTVDAVEVVRCEKCIHWRAHDINGKRHLGRCQKWGKVCKASDFCSYGERRTDEPH